MERDISHSFKFHVFRHGSAALLRLGLEFWMCIGREPIDVITGPVTTSILTRSLGPNGSRDDIVPLPRPKELLTPQAFPPLGPIGCGGVRGTIRVISSAD